MTLIAVSQGTLLSRADSYGAKMGLCYLAEPPHTTQSIFQASPQVQYLPSSLHFPIRVKTPRHVCIPPETYEEGRT